MATFDKTGSGPLLGQKPFNGLDRVYVAEHVVDLTGGALTTGDVYQCLAIPANTLVMKVEVEIITAAVGTTCTLDVGDGGAANGWDNDIDGKAVAGTVTASAVGTDARAASAAMGYKYTSADSIDITVDTATAITAGPKFAIRALCVDFDLQAS